MLTITVNFYILKILNKFLVLQILISIIGRIEKAEMVKLVTAIYDLEGIKDRKGANDPKVRASEIFGKMDKNYSNNLDVNEFVNGCLADPILMRFLNPQN